MKPLRHNGTPVGWKYFINTHGKRSAIYNVRRRYTTPLGKNIDYTHDIKFNHPEI